MRPRLFSFERVWTDAAFDAIHPEGTALGPGVGSMHPARFLDETLRRVPLEQSIGIRFALWMVALSPLFTIGKLATIAGVPREARERALARLLASRSYAVRQLALSFKAMAALLYAQSDVVRARMNAPRAPAAGVRQGHGADAGAGAERAAAQDVPATSLVTLRASKGGDAASPTAAADRDGHGRSTHEHAAE